MLSNLNFDDYSYIEKSFANVQNSYTKYDGDVLVASSSIPFYHDTPLNFYDRKVKLRWGIQWRNFYGNSQITVFILETKFIMNLIIQYDTDMG